MIRPKGSIVLTGANGGLGCAAISHIASSPELSASYHGIYLVRNVATSHALDATLSNQNSPQNKWGKNETPHSNQKLSLDLSQLDDVRRVAREINEDVAAGKIPWIHALILNAGYEEFQKQTWTRDGLDTTFAINYLGHWLLMMLLLQSMDREVGRIVWVSSWAHNPHDPRNSWNGSFSDAKYHTIFSADNIDDIAKGVWSPNSTDLLGWAAPYRRYGASKLCGVTMISELQRRLDRDPTLNNVSVLGIDPGLVNTGMVRRSESWVFRVLLWQIVLPVITVVLVLFLPNGPLRTAKKSSSDIVAAAIKNGPPPLSERPKGIYLSGSELRERNPEAKDPAKGAMLWRDTLRYTKLKAGETALENWQ